MRAVIFVGLIIRHWWRRGVSLDNDHYFYGRLHSMVFTPENDGFCGALIRGETTRSFRNVPSYFTWYEWSLPTFCGLLLLVLKLEGEAKCQMIIATIRTQIDGWLLHKQTYVYVKALLTIRSMQVVPHVVNWYLATDRIPNTWFCTTWKLLDKWKMTDLP